MPALPVLAQMSIPDTIPMALFDSIHGLKPGSQALYCYLWSYFKSNGCFPTRTETLQSLSIGTEAYSSYLKALKENQFVSVKQSTDHKSRFGSNDYILTYPGSPCAEITHTEKPSSAYPHTRKPVLRLIPRSEKQDTVILNTPKPLANTQNPMTNLVYNNNTNNQKEEEDSSSSSYDYTELNTFAMKMADEYPLFKFAIDIFFKTVVKERFQPDTQDFRYIVDKFVLKTDTSRVTGPLSAFCKGFARNEYPGAKIAMAKEDQKKAKEMNSSIGKDTADKRKNYEIIRNNNIKLQKEREEYISRIAPDVIEIETNLNTLGSSLSKLVLSGNKKEFDEIKTKQELLIRKKNDRLNDLGLDADFLEPVYNCKDCKDTGINEQNGDRCHCYYQ